MNTLFRVAFLGAAGIWAAICFVLRLVADFHDVPAPRPVWATNVMVSLFGVAVVLKYILRLLK